MLKIRLKRVGRRHDPSFRVILTDSRRGTKSGAYLENLGFNNPRTKEKGFKADRIKHWISKGAQPSKVVHNFLVEQKIIEGLKKNVVRIKRKAEAEAPTPEGVGVPTQPEADVGKQEVKVEQQAEKSVDEAPKKASSKVDS